MPEDLRAQIVQSMVIQVQRRLGLVMMEALDERSAGEFAALMERKPEPSPKEIVDFFQARIENFDQVMGKALAGFADEFVQGAERLVAEAKSGSAVAA